jgi:hypothetical protein
MVDENAYREISSMKPLSYSSFSLDLVRRRFGVHLSLKPLFAEAAPIPPSDFLRQSLQRAADLSLLSEKARSEFIVAPILLELRELCHHEISIYSGVRFDVAADEGLQGVCDFIVTRTPPFPTIQAPLMVMVEAKKNAIEEGLGQCAAEMLAAQRLNREEQTERTVVYGCVTTGELWQFMALQEQELCLDPAKIYIEHVDNILGILFWMSGT